MQIGKKELNNSPVVDGLLSLEKIKKNWVKFMEIVKNHITVSRYKSIAFFYANKEMLEVKI